MKPTIKKAEIQDLARLNEIAIASKSHWGYPKAWIEKWRDDLSRTEKDLEEQEVYKMELADVIIGYCAIQELEESYELTNLWLLPEHIGKSYGKILLWETIALVVKKQKTITLEADPNAEAFYASQGFETFGKKESFPKGRFLPLMRK